MGWYWNVGEGGGTAAGDGEGAAGAGAEGAGVAGPDWFDSLPPDLKVDKYVLGFKGKPVAEVAKALVVNHATARGSIQLPKPDAPPEVRQKALEDIWGKLGRPDAADKYQIALPPMPQGMSLEGDGLESFKAAAHGAGLNGAQVQAMVNWYGGRLAQGVVGRNQQLEEATETLQGEWGGTFGKKVALAARTVKQLFPPAFATKLEQTGFGNDPDFIRGLAAIGEALAEDGIIAGEVEGVPGPEEAKAKIREILNTKDHPATKASAPGHAEAAEELRNLYRLAYGTKAVLEVR